MITEPVPVNLVAEVPFYLSRDNEVYGPYLLGQAERMLDDEVLSAEDLIWIEGWEDWQPVEAAFGLTSPGETTPSGVTDLPATEQASLAAEDWQHPGAVASVTPDGVSRRLLLAAAITVGVHLFLFLIASLVAPQLFKIVPYAQMAAPKPAPPLEVSFVPEEDASPPTPTPPSVPPPMLQPPPPPPPAPPVIPLSVPPPPPISSMDSLPGPPPIADPALASPPEATPAKAKRMVTKMVHRASAPSVVAPTAASPTTTQVTEAGPSDSLDAPPPQYPPEALQRREAGTVILRVTIDADGEPSEVEIERSSGYAVLDNAARKQVRDSYRFKVGDSRILLVPIDFQLDR